MSNDVQRIIKGELIGKEVTIKDSENKANVGIAGKIIDETKYTLTVRTKDGNKKVLLKKQNTLTFGQVTVNGTALIGRPEERIKNN